MGARDGLDQAGDLLAASAGGPVRLVAESPATRAALSLAMRAAASDIAVLFEGESGVGKEVFARAVHAASPRAPGPFVAVNCGALPEALVESILFGHERGAFTGAVARQTGRFAEADGGVIFLDELGELPLAAQVKLLRALQEGEIDPVGAARPQRVNVRVLAATNRDLRREVAAGRFREDLFYRVSAFPIRIPPLRARREDIAPLARRILAAVARAEGVATPELTQDALDALRAAPWPGNVRELENALHRAAVLAGGGALTARHLEQPGGAARPEDEAARSVRAFAEDAAMDRRTLADVEAEHILRVYGQCGGRISETARRLGIGRTTLYRKLADLGVAPTERR
ncbi:sigma-54 interaction domain-containing protein [Rubrimonas cliftonensis]|uniref:Nif-specific regulatory protein n=1 Tax=Rubrimonas cliftonensis TaxID=89524 RepID=A0A1H4B7N3_9RHOB|nr:sigma-54 dependent transcriptional regulator [Rubrimonas cliftonensis]SEA44255.1 regulatory protein, Fis family [Rubrimonas cliftonensis]